MKNVIALVLGGGQGTRLSPLTKMRAKPAVPLAGKYRLIDIPLSNCIHSNINKIYVLTQFMSVSLHRHIRQTYRFDQFSGGYVELLAASETAERGSDWYQGTADAVRKNLRNFESHAVDYVLILSGDQLYRMDYRKMLQMHIDSQADVTIAAMPVTREAARSLGVMKINGDGRVTGFLEKPQTDKEIDMVANDPAAIDALGVASGGRDCLASMGIYIFNAETLHDALAKTDYQDFGKEIFPVAIRTRQVQAFPFDGYWEDIGTIRAFFDANLSLASAEPPFELANEDRPIYSRARFLPPTLLEGAEIRGSLIADGCRIGKGTTIENSVIGLRCIIGENVTIRDSVLMGADFFDGDEVNGDVPLGVGDGTQIRNAIVDKNCRIGAKVQLVGSGNDPDTDFDADVCVRDGVVVVSKDATVPDNWKLESILKEKAVS